ncbi:MAG TPA: hypothetical protein ENJ80_04130 [Gammaproteobacteria bacterium]|nr:hypothetical protein [Gammaproteobacteria bacterium]
MAETPLRVWVLSDDQPGHLNLSRGVVLALQRLGPVQDTCITFRLRMGLMRNLLRALLNHTGVPLPVSLLKLFYVFDALPAQGCDLVVSAGGKTSFANAWLARSLRVPNVFTGSLRRLSPQLFSAVLTLEPNDATPVSLVLDLPPGIIDEATLSAQAAQFREQYDLVDQHCWCMLIGGDGAGYRYHEPDWQALAQAMNRLAKHYGIRWLVVSSRRTGYQAAQQLRRLLEPDSLAVQCWHDLGDEYLAGAFLGTAEKIFVTEDSMTMLGEAMSARRPVYSLRPRQVQPNTRYRDMIRRFAERRLLCRFTLEELARQPKLPGKTRCQVLETSPQATLSRQLAKQLDLKINRV